MPRAGNNLERGWTVLYTTWNRSEVSWIERAYIIRPARPGSMNPVKLMRNHKKTLVRFADSTMVVQALDDEPVEFVSTPKSQASRSMLATGRHLLVDTEQFQKSSKKMHSISLTPEKKVSRTPLEAKKQRLHSLNVDLASPASVQRFDQHKAFTRFRRQTLSSHVVV